MEDIEQTIKTHNEIFELCLEKNITFVSYRQPNTSQIYTLIQYTRNPLKTNKLEDLLNFRGFVFAPFMYSTEFPYVMIEPDIILTGGEDDIDVLEKLEEVKNQPPRDIKNKNGQPPVSRELFMNRVEKIKTAIQYNTLDKLVLSRIHYEPRPQDFKMDLYFRNLHDEYPDAFVYMLCIPGLGCWSGASPEPLVTIENNEVETISLAGTRKYEDIPSKKSGWTAKEYEEQQLVTNYIEEVLKRREIPEYFRHGPETQRAGNLLHLKTEFKFSLQYLKEDVSGFIDELHPTPSISGLPKEEARLYLQQIENHQREYYAGFLGPVNISGALSLYVNLRCMKVYPGELALYLGAGITSGSNPEDEWEETNSKKMTLLSVIKNSNSVD
jgi:isochorismate synthase